MTAVAKSKKSASIKPSTKPSIKEASITKTTTGTGSAASAGGGGTTTTGAGVPAPSNASAATIAACIALVQQLLAILPSAAGFASVSKRRSLKLRKGGEAIASLVLSVAKQYGVAVPLLTTDSPAAQITTLTALAELVTNLTDAQTTLSDYQFALQSSLWTTTTALYSILKRAAKTNSNVKTALAPATQFFSYRNPVVAAKHPKTAKGKAALKATTAAASAGGSAPGSSGSTNAAVAPATAAPMHS